MKLKHSGTNYYFSIPLQQIEIEKYGIKIPAQYGFCSFYYPMELQDEDDYIYFIKVYDFFNENPNQLIKDIKEHPLLFGESRFYPGIPTRGKMKWILLDEEKEIRELESFPDLKESNLLTDRPPQERIWWLMKNGQLNEEQPLIKLPYDEVKHLEFSDLLEEVGVKYRIYIRLIKKELNHQEKTLTLEEWKSIMFSLIRKEEAAKKATDKVIHDGIIENYIYDQVDVWSWDVIPDIPNKKNAQNEK